jgi:manganese transport protein
MEGFINLRLKPWLRRLITRLIAITPAFIITILYGEKGTTNLLILSQVILSIQLSFAVVPLVIFTSNKDKMGKFANKPVWKYSAWVISIIIMGFNAFLLYQTFSEWLG